MRRSALARALQLCMIWDLNGAKAGCCMRHQQCLHASSSWAEIRPDSCQRNGHLPEHSGPTRPSSHGGQLRSDTIRTAGVPRSWFHSQQEHQVVRLCVTGSPRVPDGSAQPPRAVEPGHLGRPQVKASQTRGRHHRHGYDDEAAVPPGRAPSWCVPWCSWGSTTRMLPDAARTPQWGSVASKAKDKPTDRPLCVQRSARLRLPGSERSTQTGSR